MVKAISITRGELANKIKQSSVWLSYLSFEGFPETKEAECSLYISSSYICSSKEPSVPYNKKLFARLFCCQSGLLFSKEVIAQVKENKDKSCIFKPFLWARLIGRCIHFWSGLLTFQSCKSLFNGFVACVCRVMEAFYLRIWIPKVRWLPSTQNVQTRKHVEA
jgi:hypothetical protein